MKKLNKITGRIGEETAVNFLIKKGYKIIGRNFSTRFGELDLIVKKNKTLVFVEVKTRIGDYSQPEWAIDSRKIEQVRKMAERFIALKKPSYENLRIDVFCVILKNKDNVLSIKHYQNLY